MFQKYTTKHDGVGTVVDVEIDYNANIIKRSFHEGSVTVNGTQHEYKNDEVTEFFENEIYWLQELKSKWVPELIDIDYAKKEILQKYYGPCLLDSYKNKKYLIYVPDIKKQIIEMYTFFKEKNVYKRNGSLSNLTHNNGQLIAFDFKWAKQRPKGKKMEIFSYDTWLVKIDKTLPAKLKEIA